VYGKDVDLAARLASVANGREIVMNRAFYQEVLADYGTVGAGAGFDEVQRIQPSPSVTLKGFVNPVELFVYHR
jgi:class 3 adenylate cyclase